MKTWCFFTDFLKFLDNFSFFRPKLDIFPSLQNLLTFFLFLVFYFPKNLLISILSNFPHCWFCWPFLTFCVFLANFLVSSQANFRVKKIVFRNFLKILPEMTFFQIYITRLPGDIQFYPICKILPRVATLHARKSAPPRSMSKNKRSWESLTR